jgi:hypothetical protein
MGEKFVSHIRDGNRLSMYQSSAEENICTYEGRKGRRPEEIA